MGFIQVGMEEDFANFFSEHFLGFGTFFFKANFWVHCLFPTHVDVECHPSTIWTVQEFTLKISMPHMSNLECWRDAGHTQCVLRRASIPKKNLLVAFVQVE